MRRLLFFIFVLANLTGFSQKKRNHHFVSFVTVFNKNNVTKDGYYIKDYVVEIDHEQGERLHGKRVQISGYVTYVPGIHFKVKKSKDGHPPPPPPQAREGTTKHLLQPKIKVVGS